MSHNHRAGELAGGYYVEPSKTTLAVFLDHWLAHIEPSVAPRTHERYQEIARKNLAPLLGQTVLRRLRPEQIAASYAKALKSGRRDGTGGLSPRTVHHMHRILKQALATALRWRVLPYNPVDGVDAPKVERSIMKALDPAETARLLAHFRGTRMFTPVLLAVMCGLRRGEITALRWASVDFAVTLRRRPPCWRGGGRGGCDLRASVKVTQRWMGRFSESSAGGGGARTRRRGSSKRR